MGSTNNDASETLTLLEDRLRRIDFILNGDTLSPDEEPLHSIPAAAVRLRNLERGLQLLAAKSPAVVDLLELHETHPEIFPSAARVDAPTSLPTPALASLILAHATSYRNTASQLSQLKEISVPDPATATKLIEEQQRIETARVRQEQQFKEFSELRTRSARLVEEWHEGGVLEIGERWASWEERLKEVEILVRRREAAKKRDEGTV